MRLQISLSLILLIIGISTMHAQPDPFVFALKAGGSGFDQGNGIASDAAGNIFVIGFFQDTAMFGDEEITSTGFRDIFIAKYDNNGNILWANRAGGGFEDDGLGIATDGSGNCLVTGNFSQTASFGDTTLTTTGSDDIFISKYSGDGEFLWAAGAGGGHLDQGNSITSDAENNCIVTGFFSDSVSFADTTIYGAGNYDIFVAKYDPSGALLWARHAGGEFFDQGNGIVTDISGNIYVTGKFSGTASFGDTTITSTRSFNSFISAYTPGGDLLWVEKAGGTRDDFASGIAVHASGDIVVTGYFQETGTFGDSTLTSFGSGDIYVARYRSDGSLVWVKQAGGENPDQGYAVAADHLGNIMVTGFFVGPAQFGDTTLSSEFKDIFVAKYDSAGQLVWAQKAGGSTIEEGYGITADASGNAFFTGYFEGAAAFGDSMITPVGARDVFISKIGSTGGISGIISSPGRMESFDLYQNYPNPFNPVTTIRYRLAAATTVTLEIFDVTGRRVRTLVDGQQPAGNYSVIWNGRDHSERQAATGIYFYRLRAGNSPNETDAEFIQMRRMLLLK